MIDVCLLGTGGMMPLPNRFLTSCLIRHGGSMMLIDCGEATQIALQKTGWGFKNIDVICFTHFHADHISGIIGMLLMMKNADRTEPLTIIGVEGVEKVINSLRIVCPHLSFDINFIERKASDVTPIELIGLQINTLPVQHRLPCLAYSVEVKRAGRFDVERAKAQNIPMPVWTRLQKNDSVVWEGVTYTSDMVLGEARKGIKISYCTDCRPSEKISQFVKNSDLFIAEGIYGDDEKEQNAIKYKHTTIKEAIEQAKNGNVDELWLTHFSPSMVNPLKYNEFVRNLFPNGSMGADGMWKTFSFED